MAQKRGTARCAEKETPTREVFPSSPEWFDECDRNNLGLAVRLHGIERVAARLIEDLPVTLRKHAAALKLIEAYRARGTDESSPQIQNQWAFADAAERERNKCEQWLWKLADQATAYLPELSLPNITQKPVGLDSAEKQKPILAELEKIKAAAIRLRVKAESGTAKVNDADKSECPRGSWPRDPRTGDLIQALQRGLAAGKSVEEINREFAKKHKLNAEVMKSVKRGARRWRHLWEKADK